MLKMNQLFGLQHRNRVGSGVYLMAGELAELHVREKKGAEPLTEKEKRTAEEFIRKYHKNIIDKWVKFFVMKQSVRSTNIKKKL